MFNDLTPTDYKKLYPFFSSQSHRLCYYSLSSLIVWANEFSKPVWKVELDALVAGMKFYSKPEKNYLLLPIANGKELSPAQIYKIAINNQFNKYQFVPEDYVNSHNYTDLKHLFTVIEQPRYEDYLYRTSDLAELKGTKYSKKRNLISQFRKIINGDYNVEMGPITDADIPECLDFLDFWASTKKYDIDTNEDATCEKQAAINALNNIERLGLRGLLLKINGQIKAFGIGSQLTDSIGGFHFQKADPTVKGLYQYFDQQCARELFTEFEYINKECDMGDPGLKQAKRSYYPETTVKSYQLILK